MSARLGAQMIRNMQVASRDADAITLPMLILQGDDDHLVDPAGAQMLHDIIRSKDKKLIVYPGLSHEVFNEPEREQVMDDVEAWLGSRLS
jgi:alpha-beta hydrolase superfamily lysophospholipase